MTTMTWTIIVVIIVMAVALVVARKYKNVAVSAAPVIIIYALLAAVAGIGGVQLQQFQSARLHDLCVERVERSAGSRAYNLKLISIVDRELPNSGIAAELLAALDLYLPPLTIEGCP